MGYPRILTSALLLAAPLFASCDSKNSDFFLLIAGPFEIRSFEVLDVKGETIWRLEADPPRPISRLLWNRIPAGFTQSVPGRGQPPRDLITGEKLQVETRTSSRVFTHTGIAKSTRTFEITNSSMRTIPKAAPLPSASDR
jgi:hypothetical protein